MKIVTLIAEGPNSVEVPCRLFEGNIEEAKIKCDSLLGIEGKKAGSTYVYRIDNYSRIGTGVFYKLKNIVPKENLHKYKSYRILENKIIDGKTEEEITLFGKLFTKKYRIRAIDKKYRDDELVLIEYDEEETTDQETIIGDKLFNRYYNGCGGVSRYILTYITTDSKFTTFDLD